MKIWMKRKISVFLTFLLVITISSAISVSASDNTALDDALENTAAYLCQTVATPQVGSIGGEWTVIGLARSGLDVPEDYFNQYAAAAEEYIASCGGVLHERKYTEYSRVAIAFTSIGRDPRNVAGFDMLMPLGDFEKTVWQGINGAIWALIALDCGAYDVPINPDAAVQATRELYLQHILENQGSDGGWSLTGSGAVPEMTGMALQALSKYMDREEVQQAVEKALSCMSGLQDEDGGFSSWGQNNLESSVQMLVGLCELNISVTDPRFVKNGNTILDNLLSYYEPDKGFLHVKDGSGSGLMATEQGFYGMVAVKRQLEGKSSLYDMSDHPTGSWETVTEENQIGLPGKNADVQMAAVTKPGKTFTDINGHKNSSAIEALASREIINGKSDDLFSPDETMTRAEFAAIVIRGLGLAESGMNVFDDVTLADWFYNAVGTAYQYGIVNGISETEFNPNGTVTREETAVMIERAAELCGLQIQMDATAARDVLAGFIDYVKASQWAMPSLAVCVQEGIISDEELELRPKEPVTRAEVAQMLYNLLDRVKLL